MSIRTATLTVCMMALANVEGFTVAPQTTSSSVASSRTSELFMAKGFGAKPVEKKEKSEGQIKREQERSKYDEIAGTGGNEYSTWLKSNNILQTTLVPFSHHCLLWSLPAIFVRQFGSDDQSWLPCGAIAVPRGAQVSDAIYSNVEALQSGIVRTYPKLKGYEQEFEFGYNLKIYPDDPIEVAVNSGPRDTGFSFGNWISTLLSPIDASKATPPPSSS